ncbi:MAG TPA: HD domain-containing protein [Patescibacteria group bacterium]|nr:HD domain-containing protein [Patescibacteria group bacterium]
MTDKQLDQIKEFVKSLDPKIDQFHDSRHAELTVTYALLLANDYPETDLKLLEAACWLHDIGRINVDEGHAYESAKLAKPFLENIHFPSHETEAIIHAVYVHNPKDIHTAQSIEAKLLFDADKIQQLSVFGFIRAINFQTAILHQDLLEIIEKRWQKIQDIQKHLQTDRAKEILEPEMKKIEQLVNAFKNGANGTLS